MTKTCIVTQRSLDARQLALQLMAKHGLNDYQFFFSKSRRMLGRCVFPCEVNNFVGRIELSVHYTEQGGDVRDTILHEIAHALADREAGDKGHGRAWKAICLRIGAKPERCAVSDAISYKWVAKCPHCKRPYKKHRLSRRAFWWCPPCGPEKGRLVFREE